MEKGAPLGMRQKKSFLFKVFITETDFINFEIAVENVSILGKTDFKNNKFQTFIISDFYFQLCLGQIYEKMQKEIPKQFWVTRYDSAQLMLIFRAPAAVGSRW